ncbi:hypothetical protein HMPREF0671_06055 [Prevotella sp. S7 MS 2]|nr:hypothetical protein HMPREF0671_06055 [Prevotella sp. S7 MS 2]
MFDTKTGDKRTTIIVATEEVGNGIKFRCMVVGVVGESISHIAIASLLCCDDNTFLLQNGT